jgi:hypothetical protein
MKIHQISFYSEYILDRLGSDNECVDEVWRAFWLAFLFMMMAFNSMEPIFVCFHLLKAKV